MKTDRRRPGGPRRFGCEAAIVCAALGFASPLRSEDGARAEIERGSYLVHRVAMCAQCHSERDREGELLDHELLKGSVVPLASPFAYQVWAYRTPKILGLPTGYSEQDLVVLLTEGRTKSGSTPRPPMPPFRLTEPDARAIAAYLAWVGTQIKVTDVSVHEEVEDSVARAKLKPVAEGNVSGTVTFTWHNHLMHIEADIAGLSPGLHGIHINESVDCDAAIASGGHFNPGGESHSAPNAKRHHLGDLGNVVADENGNAHYERFDPRITVDGDRSIVGRTVVIDAAWDDLKTDPDGNSGAHIACGRIDRL
jgi:Cu-Zn family superoxide dismutase